MNTPLNSGCRAAFGNIITIFAGLFLLIGCYSASYAQQKLYISQTDIGQAAQSFLSANDIKQVYTFNVVGNSFESLNRDKIAADIKRRYPDSSASGIGVLDWEGKPLNTLGERGPITPEFQNTLNDFIKILQFAKSLRQNVKWGFYNVPLATYYNRDNGWKQANSNLMPLLQQCDVFCPSLYTPYKEGTMGSGDNEAFAADNVLEALTLASGMNKPVLPFVWHRYHVSNKKIGLQLIPLDEFKRYLKTILSVNYHGQKVAGIIWWGSDTYYYNTKSQALLDEMSQNSQGSFATYHDNLIINYGKEILKTVKKQ